MCIHNFIVTFHVERTMSKREQCLLLPTAGATSLGLRHLCPLDGVWKIPARSLRDCRAHHAQDPLAPPCLRAFLLLVVWSFNCRILGARSVPLNQVLQFTCAFFKEHWCRIAPSDCAVWNFCGLIEKGKRWNFTAHFHGGRANFKWLIAPWG